MTLDQFQRAKLVDFAHQQAIHTGSIAAMKAVALVLRNRVRGGWHDGNWLAVIQEAEEASGNEPWPAAQIDVYSRGFQMLLQAIDDIYYGNPFDENLERTVGKALYYQFIDKPLRPWFTENIILQPSHQRHAVIGATMLLYD